MDNLTLLFAGAVVSLLVELVKKYFGMTRLGSLAILVGLSLLGGAGAWYLQNTGLWEAFVKIIATSAVVYAFVIKNVEIAIEKKSLKLW